MEPYAFVTVGTTSFDALIDTVSSMHFLFMSSSVSPLRLPVMVECVVGLSSIRLVFTRHGSTCLMLLDFLLTL